MLMIECVKSSNCCIDLFQDPSRTIRVRFCNKVPKTFVDFSQLDPERLDTIYLYFCTKMKVLTCGTTATLLVVPILIASLGSTLAYSLVQLDKRRGCRGPSRIVSNKLDSTAPSATSDGDETGIQNFSRRDVIQRILSGGTSGVMLMTTLLMTSHPLPASAAPDCFKDCMKNCKEIAPKDPDYCTA